MRAVSSSLSIGAWQGKQQDVAQDRHASIILLLFDNFPYLETDNKLHVVISM